MGQAELEQRSQGSGGGGLSTKTMLTWPEMIYQEKYRAPFARQLYEVRLWATESPVGAEALSVEGCEVGLGVGKEGDVGSCCVLNRELSGPSVASHLKLLENGEPLHLGWQEPESVQE